MLEETIKNALRKKLETYKPETSAMPFHTRLLGQDRLALYSFIHSLSTNFGTTIFEPLALNLAGDRFKKVETQFKPNTQISTAAQRTIQDIIDHLTTAGNPSKISEINRIRGTCRTGEVRSIKTPRVDIYLEGNNNDIYMIDLKTAKPNKSNFKDFKRTLLEWVALVLFENPSAEIHTLIAIPYNPYAPKPYDRWTMVGMLDTKQELKVAEEFWDFLGGAGAYDDLLDCFERVGCALRAEIDTYFSHFHKR